MGAGVVAAHHIVHAGPHVLVPHADQPGHCLWGQDPAGGQLAQSGGQVIKTPGPGEVEAVKVDKLAVCPVNNLAVARLVNMIQ